MEGSDGTDHTVENLHRNSIVYDMENPKGSRPGDYLLHDSRTGPERSMAGMTTGLGKDKLSAEISNLKKYTTVDLKAYRIPASAVKKT
ncbi:hypothetical protein V6N11_080081 [Hibiscus sabdariffa]|uniref:Uncharacterized protein n=1 Tax=Hibiscus sabdariffa TaxID=183260 RepID=A0ABR2RY06_9ROSI